jgi:hypothetical protein
VVPIAATCASVGAHLEVGIGDNLTCADVEVGSRIQPQDRARLASTLAFAAEADMLAAIARAPTALAGRRRGSRDPQVLFEFLGSQGTPDVVFLEFDERELVSRESLLLAPVLAYTAVAVLVALSTGALTTAELAARTRVTAPHLRRAILPSLEASSWLVRDGRRWRSPTPIRPLAKWILAVEAKRRDWRRALAQADRYRRFANRAIVVLDANANTGPALLMAESERRVGLATVDSTRGRVETLVLPPWRTASSEIEFIWAGEQAYAMHRSGAVSGPVLPVFGRYLLATQGPDPRMPNASLGASRVGVVAAFLEAGLNARRRTI